jgi:ribosomal silencing factor RsfS
MKYNGVLEKAGMDLKAFLALITVFIIASVMQTAQIDSLLRETREAAVEFYELRAECEELRGTNRL